MVVSYGVLWFAGYTLILNAAERHLDAGTAAMLVNIAPILVAVDAGLFMAEGFPRPLVVGIIVAFAGVMIIAIGGIGGHSDGLGILLGVATAVLYAAGVLTQKVALRTVDAVTATWVGCVVGTLVLTPFLPQAVREFSAAPGGSIAAVVYLGVFPTAVAFTLLAFALTNTAAGRLTSTTLAVPAIVVLMSWILLGEVPTAYAMAGGVLCLLGVAISWRRTRAGTAAPGNLHLALRSRTADTGRERPRCAASSGNPHTRTFIDHEVQQRLSDAAATTGRHHEDVVPGPPARPVGLSG